MRKQKEEATRNKKDQLVKELSIEDMLRIRGGDGEGTEPTPIKPPVY